MRNIRTIGLRLTLWGTGITLGVSLLVCAVLYAGVWRSLYGEVDNFLEGEINEFMGVVREHQGDYAKAQEEISKHLGSRVRTDLRFRVLDERGVVLVTSDPNDPVPVVFMLMAPESRTRNGAHFKTLKLPGRSTQLRVCTMVVTQPGGPSYTAQASYTLDRVQASLTSLRRVAAISLLTAAILAIVAGRILAKRSLAPLHQITSTAQQISERHLSGRIYRSNNGDEIDRLAGVLNDLLNRVEKYVRQMQQFTADASHELRSPLAALRGSAEVALSRDRTPYELRSVLEESVVHYDRLIRIAEDLLLLARLDAGEAVFRQEPVDLHRAVEDVVDLYGPLAAERGLSLTLQSEMSTMVTGDPGRLRQMISNLVDNAIKYTPASGSIQISLSRVNDSARLTVVDSGIGIESQELGKVFDRFHRVDPSRSHSANSGVGLGLAICRSIVEAHSGLIALQSQPGSGTVVAIQLPISHKVPTSDPSSRMETLA